MDLVSEFLNGNYMPHGHCFLWRRDLLLMHVGGDLLTAGAYFAIPAALVQLVRKRSDLAFNWIFLMFALFIFCCGVTHIIDAVNVWHGYYHLEGSAKVMTALVSVITAVLVWRLLPAALAVPGHQELLQKNNELLKMEGELRRANSELEQRVRARTVELEALASTDSLTGLNNRRSFLQNLHRELDRAERYGHPISLLLLDIDNFKQFNDENGHQAGDVLLKETSDLFERECRSTDIVARYGGEEFVLLLPETPGDEAASFAERLLQAMRTNMVDIDGTLLSATCSIGVAQALPHEAVDQLINRADRAMYSAKQQGKDRIAVSE